MAFLRYGEQSQDLVGLDSRRMGVVPGPGEIRSSVRAPKVHVSLRLSTDDGAPPTPILHRTLDPRIIFGPRRASPRQSTAAHTTLRPNSLSRLIRRIQTGTSWRSRARLGARGPRCAGLFRIKDWKWRDISVNSGFPVPPVCKGLLHVLLVLLDVCHSGDRSPRE